MSNRAFAQPVRETKGVHVSLMLAAPTTAVTALVPAGDRDDVLTALEAADWYAQHACTLQEANEIRARAIAVEAYIKHAKLGRDVVLKARAVNYVAARRVGEFLRRSQRARGGRPGKTGSCLVPQKTLNELGISKKDSAFAQNLFDLPLDLFEKLRDSRDEMTLAKARDIARQRMQRTVLLDVDVSIPPHVCDLRVSTCAELFASGVRPDAVITTPPSEKASLPVFTELAKACSRAQVRFVAIQVSPRYLPDILARLCAHLPYRWTSPGDGSALILTFATEADIAARRSWPWEKRADTCIGGVVQHVSTPGDLVCDPFLSTTVGIEALNLRRRFVGSHPDASTVTKGRKEIEQEVSFRHLVRYKHAQFWWYEMTGRNA